MPVQRNRGLTSRSPVIAGPDEVSVQGPGCCPNRKGESSIMFITGVLGGEPPEQSPRSRARTCSGIVTAGFGMKSPTSDQL